MGSVVYFSSRVFTENLGEREGEGAVGCQVTRQGNGEKERLNLKNSEWDETSAFETRAI